jgi:hypothetical protein
MVSAPDVRFISQETQKRGLSRPHDRAICLKKALWLTRLTASQSGRILAFPKKGKRAVASGGTMTQAQVATHANAEVSPHTYGALVGWKLEPGGEQLQLVLKTVSSREALRDRNIDCAHVMLTRQQALQLANYLYAVTGETRPSPRKGAWSRLMG